MSIPVVLWFLLALAQADGPVAGGFGSKEACETARQEIMEAADALAVSKCIEVTLDPISLKTEPVPPPAKPGES